MIPHGWQLDYRSTKRTQGQVCIHRLCSHLPTSPFWMPDPNGLVEMVHNCYIGVWLNGTSQESSSRSSVAREWSPTWPSALSIPALLSVLLLPVFSSIPASLGLPPNTPLPYSANIAFMWSPSSNTLSPVLLQGNATVIPYPLPSKVLTLSAPLPQPFAATLVTSSTSASMGTSNSSLWYGWKHFTHRKSDFCDFD